MVASQPLHRPLTSESNVSQDLKPPAISGGVLHPLIQRYSSDFPHAGKGPLALPQGTRGLYTCTVVSSSLVCGSAQ